MTATLLPYTKDLSDSRYMGPRWTSTQPNSNPESRYLDLPGKLTGVRDPDWRTKVRDKKDATTPLSVMQDSVKIQRPTGRYLHEVKPGFGYTIVTYETLGLWWQQYTNPSLEFPGSIDANWDAVKQARNIALTYYNKYVAENMRPVSSHVFLGEIKETLEFLRHPFGKMRALADSAKMARYNAIARGASVRMQRYRSGVDKLSPSEIIQVSNDVADAWFEVRFALLPLVSDITSGLQVALRGQLTEKRDSFAGKAQGNVTIPYQTSMAMSPELNGVATIRQWIDAEYYIHAGIKFEDQTSYDGLSEYLDNSTKSMVEWIPTIWELIPGSWFVDYFVNVGSILESIANNSYVEFSYNCHTAIANVRRRYEFNRTSNYAAYIQMLEEPTNIGYVERSRKFLERKTSTDMNLSVRYKIPIKPVQLVNSAFHLSRKFQNLFSYR